MQNWIWRILTWWLSGIGLVSTPLDGGDATTTSCDGSENCGEIVPGFDPTG